MRRIIFASILLIFILSAAGCSKKELYISTEDVTSNTMLVKRNGQLQVAIVEDFSKAYYKLNELEEFVKKEINTYNKNAGGEDVTIEDLKLKNGNAVMLIGYTGMKHYASFNKVMAAYFAADTKDVALELPDQYVSAKNGDLVDRSTALKDGKYRVLVVYEPYDVIVDGSVKYYSNNAKPGKDNVIHSADEGATVIIYKPTA